MALFSRVKTWVSTEDVTYSDLNAEFDNIIDHLTPAYIDDYSANVSQMQTTTDPGEVGTESLATTLAGEIARIRFLIKEITGEAQWYASPDSSIASISSALNVITPDNRLVSGRVRTSNTQSIALVPNGAAATATVKGATTNLVYVIAGTQYSIITDTNITGLSTAPASNNTCLVNDAGIADTEDTKYIGEFGSTITVDNMGTEITGLVGKTAGFKINNGVTDEYFMAFVESTTTLTNVRRGDYFDSSDAPIPRVAIADNDTITLMKAAWIFAKTDLTLTATYTLPFVGKTQPPSPAANDYWFDITNDYWKKYDGVSWVTATATYVGNVLTSSTVCVAARSEGYYEDVKSDNTLELEKFSSSVVRTKYPGGKVNVNGVQLDFETSYVSWDMTLDLDSGVTEAASTIYYCYLTHLGAPIISDQCPQDRRNDLLGMYHPHQEWRCVGMFHNDASSNIEAVISYHDNSSQNFTVTSAVAASALTIKVHAPPSLRHSVISATATNGVPVKAAILPGTQLVISSGSTLGTISAIAANLYLHGILYAGRLELALGKAGVSSSSLQSTTAEGGAGNADNPALVYSIAARTSVPVINLALLTSTQATAGTWATATSNFAVVLGRAKTFSKKFTSDGTFVVPSDVEYIDVDLVGGGGGGGGGGGSGGGVGGGGGGGGGAGGFQSSLIKVIPGDSLTITIGSGGTAGIAGTSGGGVAGGTGGTGNPTTVTGTGVSLSVVGGAGGGGGGGGASTNGVAGASTAFWAGGSITASTNTGGGGGGAGFQSFPVGLASAAGGAGSGAAATNPGTAAVYGGGGGGGNGDAASGGVGGGGGKSPLYQGTVGTVGTTANGGGGGGSGGSCLTAGGAGGNGSNASMTAGTDGAANSGSGGGGGGGHGDSTAAGAAGGAGGSGVVIISLVGS